MAKIIRRAIPIGAIGEFITPPWLLGLIFAGYVPLASHRPYPIIVYFVANYRPHLSHLRQISNFRDPNLVTFYFYESTYFLD